MRSLSRSLRHLSASLRSLFPKVQPHSNSNHHHHHTVTLEEMIEANENPPSQQQSETAHWKGLVGKMLGFRKSDGDGGSVLSGRTLLEGGDMEASLAGLQIWSA